MSLRLIDIPGITPHDQTVWKVSILQLNGKDLVLPELLKWEKSSPVDYKKIMNVLKMIGRTDRIRDEKKVKKSKNPKHDGVYEIRADKDHARVMFFYSNDSQSAVICTNTYWKTKSSEREQNVAFGICARLKEYYEQNK